MRTFGFIGLGLIGGSLAKGIKRTHPNDHIMAYDYAKETLQIALREHIIDTVLNDIDERISQCDFVILCTPVSYNASYLKIIKPLLKPGAILTDVGSTKTTIHEQIIALDMEDRFIGGHPMAGSERSGYEASNDHLVENAYYIITPTKKSTPSQINAMVSFASDLSAIPMVLDYKKHDYIVAAISHLPHIIASSLINLVRDSDTEEHTMKQVAAGGFKDITRIASSSPIMWQQICMANSDNIVPILQDYISSLNRIVHFIQAKDSDNLFRLFAESGEYRNSIPDRSSGPIKKEYALYCDIIDEAGAIATIATTLAIHQISIKNIGIIHNREFDQGALKIEFYTEQACIDAAKQLTACNYQIYMR